MRSASPFCASEVRNPSTIDAICADSEGHTHRVPADGAPSEWVGAIGSIFPRGGWVVIVVAEWVGAIGPISPCGGCVVVVVARESARCLSLHTTCARYCSLPCLVRMPASKLSMTDVSTFCCLL